MARRRQTGECIPSQGVYLEERDSNQKLQVKNVMPIDEINSNAKFPMPVPGRAGSSALYYQEASSEFITESHTNGKK